jgi:hypothetical protein
VRSSVGYQVGADGTESPVYATPGVLTASIGGIFTASVNSAAPTTLTVTAVLAGTLQPGDAVSGTDGTNALPVECTILAQLAGAAGGSGTYSLSAAPATGQLGACTVTSASTVLAVSAISPGVMQAGQTVTGSGVSAGTLVTGQLSGTTGGAGLYSLSQQQTVVPAVTMGTDVTIVAQVQPQSGASLRHTDWLNLQGSFRELYANMPITAGVRMALKGGDLITLANGSVWLVMQVPEPFFSTAGWQRCLMVLQDGA